MGGGRQWAGLVSFSVSEDAHEKFPLSHVQIWTDSELESDLGETGSERRARAPRPRSPAFLQVRRPARNAGEPVYRSRPQARAEGGGAPVRDRARVAVMAFMRNVK